MRPHFSPLDGSLRFPRNSWRLLLRWRRSETQIGTDQVTVGQATVNNGGVANADEYAFVKIRYKLPNEDVSKLITTPVTSANEVASFDQASTDQRFSVAVAAFGQKLRDEDATAKFGYDKIMEIATAARGPDPFGYRSEFLSLVRLASALGGNR